MCNQNTTNPNNYRYQQKCCSIFLQKNKQTKKKHEHFRNLHVINVNELKSSEQKKPFIFR